jgi:hypothetical protein
MLLEEVHDASRLADHDELPLEACLQRAGSVMVRYRASRLRRVVQFRCRSGLCHDEERAQANEYGFQNLVPPDRGQGRGLP